MASPLPAAHDDPPAQSGPSAAILADNLSKRFGQFWALRGARFSIHDGEILGLIGPNGSGKTTLFECLAGVSPATLGTVTRDGKPIEPAERKDHLYFVPDGIRPWPDQTVSWVLRFIAGMHGSPAVRVDDVVRALVTRIRCAAPVSMNYQRASTAASCSRLDCSRPQPLLMLDEPFDGLDLRQTRDVMDVLRDEAPQTDARCFSRSINSATRRASAIGSCC